MTDKNIFVYKLFLSLNISDFNLLLCENCNLPLKKVTPLFPSNSLLKVEVLSSPTFLKIWLEAQPPSPAKRRGVHYEALYELKESGLQLSFNNLDSP